MDGAVVAVLVRVVAAEPRLGLLEEGELALVAVAVVAYEGGPFVVVEGRASRPAA
jgi:hypothetical protein